ncbi:unnamed protein product [Mytilus coruscus]|uniref:Uncharacterized protein n=1 Tax=Mytilus coruscus TaxID=42192 RepID=A0A6J8F020_MYTCO|nr:unnamed protein product [Mytilus coruscus]
MQSTKCRQCKVEGRNIILADTNLTPTFKFKLKEEGRGSPYSCKVREAVYSCLQFNVSRENVSPLIKEIVRIFTGEDITSLPASSSSSTMAREAGILSELHLKETLSNSNNLTLLRDATTKRGRHYYGVKLCTDTQDFTLGTKEISCGTAEQYTEAAVEMLDNISSPENPIVSKISNFMTDRSATEIKTNRLINNVIESLEENKKTSSFHCSVHPLLQFAEETEKVAKHLENIKNLQLNKLVFKSHGESFTQNFLRCVSKIFYDDKSGDPGFSQHFLDMVGISHIPIMKFKGNRFNTYFYNAAGTFSIHQHLYKYLTSSKIRPNILQNSIIHYIRNPVILSTCQAIALVCHHITTPYFHLAASTPTALQMSSVYNQLITGLEKISEKPQLIFDKNLNIFSLQHLETKKTAKPDLDYTIFEQTETNNRDIVLEAVQLICCNLSTKSKKLFCDFLNGGKYSNPSEEMILTSKSCPANNITLERLMAQIDRQKTIAPNTSISTINSKLMFKNNGTADWLREKTEEQKNTLIVKCRQMGEEKRQRDIRDFIKIYNEKSTIIEARIEEKELKEAKIQAEKEKNYFGNQQFGRKMDKIKPNLFFYFNLQNQEA